VGNEPKKTKNPSLNKGFGGFSCEKFLDFYKA